MSERLGSDTLPRAAVAVASAVLLALPVLACGQQTVFSGASHDYQVTRVVEGLERPWGMAFLPDGRMLVTERGGRVRVIEDGALADAPLGGVPDNILVRGQGGLMDIALHPGFEANRWIYLTHSKAGERGQGTTVLVRGRLEGNSLVDVDELFEADAWSRAGVHFGSRLAFGRDGALYMTVGDRGQMQAAQWLTLAKKIQPP